MQRCSTIAMLFALLIPVSLHAAEPAAVPSPPAEEVMKAVFHVDFSDPRRLSATLQSVNNMVTTYQQQLQEYDVRIVFVSHGIRFITSDALKGTPFAVDKELAARRKEFNDRLRGLQTKQEVKLELCEITREMINLDPDTLLPGVERVKSGVVRIADLQRQGFAYLKIE
jgi:hypothetical protein